MILMRRAISNLQGIDRRDFAAENGTHPALTSPWGSVRIPEANWPTCESEVLGKRFNDDGRLPMSYLVLIALSLIPISPAGALPALNATSHQSPPHTITHLA